MALKTFRPTSPGLRHLVLLDRGQLWKGEPVKQLVEGKSRTGGRNNTGRITTRHIGGGQSVGRIADHRGNGFAGVCIDRRHGFRSGEFHLMSSALGAFLPAKRLAVNRVRQRARQAQTAVSRIVSM